MEAKKSYHLRSAGWRTNRVYGIIQVESEGLRTWNSDVWEQEKIDISDQEEREDFPGSPVVKNLLASAGYIV